MGEVHLINHPLVQHKLSILRSKETGTGQFRMLVQELSMLLAYELTRDCPLVSKTIETPMISRARGGSWSRCSSLNSTPCQRHLAFHAPAS